MYDFDIIFLLYFSVYDVHQMCLCGFEAKTFKKILIHLIGCAKFCSEVGQSSLAPVHFECVHREAPVHHLLCRRQ